MCMAKRGAEAALQRVFSITAERAARLDAPRDGGGPMGQPDAAPFDYGFVPQAGADNEGV